MNAGLPERGAWLVLSCLFGLGACERLSAEPPPPPSRHDVPAAPPAALGAHLAQGSTLAPSLEPSVPEPESEGEFDPAPDAQKDAGLPAPPEGVAL